MSFLGLMRFWWEIWRKRERGEERERSPGVLMDRKEVTFNWLKIFIEKFASDSFLILSCLRSLTTEYWSSFLGVTSPQGEVNWRTEDYRLKEWITAEPRGEALPLKVVFCSAVFVMGVFISMNLSLVLVWLVSITLETGKADVVLLRTATLWLWNNMVELHLVI